MKKGGKEEKSMVGPMFPRLHVNNTEKGGPRAPPRNKMALYEQLSIPSQRFNSGVLPLNPNKTANLASSSQGSGQEKAKYFPLHMPPLSAYSTERRNDCLSDLRAPLVQQQLEQKRLDEDDFRVPIFVNSGMDHDNRLDMETHPSFNPNFQNARDKEPKRASIVTGHNMMSHEGRNHGEENPKEKDAIKEQPVKSGGSNLLSVREKTLEKQIISSLDQEHKDHRDGDFNRSLDIDACSHQEYREKKSFSLIPRREFCHGEEMSCGKNVEDEACDSGNVDGGDDDVSEISVVDSLSGLDISPDDVVGIIGQKHFWKARKAIVNQQRAFAVQVFELHRLIKVQRMIAESPHLLHEESAYLSKPSKGGSPTKTPLPPPNVFKRKNENHPEIECSAESASFDKKPTTTKTTAPFPGNPGGPPMPPWFHQSPGHHQWLMPVMSPSEGLIYKPYSGPAGFMGPVCGGYGPPGPTPVMGNFVNPAYHGYFPPYVEQTNMQRQIHVSNPRDDGAMPNVAKVRESKDSTASSSSPGMMDCYNGGGNVLPLFPSSPTTTTTPTTRVIKVVPRNARTATESAARIFESIQEERRQYDMV